MTSDEVLAAAERLIAQVHIFLESPCRASIDRLRERSDECKQAIDAQRRREEERARPVTEDHFKKVSGGGHFICFLGDLTLMWRDGVYLEVDVWDGDCSVKEVALEIKTIGQLDDLLRGLGIEPTKKKGGGVRSDSQNKM